MHWNCWWLIEQAELPSDKMPLICGFTHSTLVLQVTNVEHEEDLSSGSEPDVWWSVSKQLSDPQNSMRIHRISCATKTIPTRSPTPSPVFALRFSIRSLMGSQTQNWRDLEAYKKWNAREMKAKDKPSVILLRELCVLVADSDQTLRQSKAMESMTRAQAIE